MSASRFASLYRRHTPVENNYHPARSSKAGIVTTIGIGALLSPARLLAEMKYNLPEPVSPLTKSVFDLHMMTSLIAFWIMVVVLIIVGYAIFKFRKSKDFEPDQEFHESKFGVWSWILVPIIVLGIDLTIAGSANNTLDEVENIGDADLTVKVTGSQWKWHYEYLEDEYSFISNLKKKEEAGDQYLRSVDNPLVLPTNKRIRLLHTATDVLHAWWVPAIAVKKDSIPGYINETWTIIEEEGTYVGQCAENCGTGHAFMPIEVTAVSPDEFTDWMKSKKGEQQAQLALASSDKTWALDELMTEGKTVYETFCAACHQADGSGTPPVFPPLKNSSIALGDIAQHMDIVIHGKQGTAMSAWAAQLNDLQLAAVITYERNAWGNNTGDVIQPADVKAAR